MCELHIITVVEWEYLALFPKRPTSEAATIEAHKPLLVISNRKEIRTTLNCYGSYRNVYYECGVNEFGVHLLHVSPDSALTVVLHVG